MGNWTLGDLIKIAICLGLGWLILQVELNSDNRPESVKYVEDPRNGCSLQTEVPVFNHMIHIAKSEYRPKILRVYLCANNITAANIEEE